MKYLAGLLFVFLHPTSVYCQSTVESIPNQKLINNSYVSNPDGILDESTIAEIDVILKSLEEKSTAQMAVVAVRSIGDADIFDFAQQLFVTWGIGSKENDNGLLLLLVEDNHTIRFHTGDGIESILPDAICKDIQRDYMVPEFKNGDYNAGMLAGIKEIEKILTNPSYTEELRASEKNDISEPAAFFIFLGAVLGVITFIVFIIKSANGRFANSKKPESTPYPEMRWDRWQWVLLFMIIPAAIVALFSLGDSTEAAGNGLLALYGYYLLTAFIKLMRMQRVISHFKKARDYYQIVQFLKSNQGYWFFAALLFPLPLLPYFIYHLFRKKIYRNHSRTCTSCNGQMYKLSETADDTFLSKGKQLEETLRSVDYDVWQCRSCQATEEWNYPRRYSKYKDCPYCHTKAYYLENRKTVVSATYSSSGHGIETHTCKFCGKSKKEKYTIAQLERSSSSSSGSSFSSSSSSGGSWGGGRSGGGGASSRW
jgi:uncharacterized protein